MQSNLISALWIASAGLATGLLSTPALALSINFDVTSGTNTDDYGPGAGVFGSSTSIWNVGRRGDDLTDYALLDDTGAASGVTVTYDRTGSGSSILTGAYAYLGISTMTASLVTVKGLTPGDGYDLAIFSSYSGSNSFTVDGVTKTLTTSADWSSLVEGTHYVLFNTLADSFGHISFAQQAGNRWTAFQIRSSGPASGPSAVPAPLPLFGAAAAFGWGRQLRRRIKSQA